MTDPFGPVQIPRDRFGRPMIVPPTGGKPVAYTRCTTFVGALEDRYNLGKWEMRMVALGLAKRPDLVLAAAALTPDDKAELDKLTEAAKEAAAASASATIGTALHRLTERLDRGEKILDGTLPSDYVDDLVAYHNTMRSAGLKVLEVERFCVLDSLRIGGTPDLIVEYEGQRYIADKKTGSIEYGALKMAMQLAVYAQGQFYDPETHERTPLGVDYERAIIIHLPAGEGRCELKWVNIARGWDAVQVAKDVREWRAYKGLLYPFDPVEVLKEQFDVEKIQEDAATMTLAHDLGQPGGAGAVLRHIRAAPSVDVLNALWYANQAQWTDEHTKAAKARKLELHQRSLREAVA